MNHQVIVLLCVVGSGVAVLMGYAFHFFMFRSESAEGATIMPGDDGFSQVQYMREVRLRNQQDIAAMSGHSKRWREMADAI